VANAHPTSKLSLELQAQWDRFIEHGAMDPSIDIRALWITFSQQLYPTHYTTNIWVRLYRWNRMQELQDLAPLVRPEEHYTYAKDSMRRRNPELLSFFLSQLDSSQQKRLLRSHMREILQTFRKDDSFFKQPWFTHQWTANEEHQWLFLGAKFGHLPLVQHYAAQYPKVLASVFRKAAYTGKQDILDWLKTHHDEHLRLHQWTKVHLNRCPKVLEPMIRAWVEQAKLKLCLAETEHQDHALEAPQAHISSTPSRQSRL